MTMRIAAVLAALIVLAGCGGGNNKSELRKTKADLAAAQEALTAADTDLAAARASLVEARAAAAMKQTEIDDLTDRLATADAELARLRTEGTADQAEIARLTTERDNLREEMAAAKVAAKTLQEEVARLMKQVTELQAQVATLLPFAPCEHNPDVDCVPPSLMPATGVAASDLPPLLATEGATLGEELQNTDNSFRAISSALVRDGEINRSSLNDRWAVDSVAGDGDAGFRVTYVDHEAEAPTTVAFTKDDLRGRTYNVMDYWLWNWDPASGASHPGERRNYDHLSVLGSVRPGGARHHILIGAETPVDSLPEGTAIFQGDLRADAYDNTVGSVDNSVARTNVRGNAVLVMNFSANSLVGQVNNIRLQAPGESGYSDAPASTGFDIAGGAIVDGRFSASITGTDSVADAPIERSMRGFSGGMIGAVYGPGGEEVGAAFTASRNMEGSDMVMLGHIVGR